MTVIMHRGATDKQIAAIFRKLKELKRDPGQSGSIVFQVVGCDQSIAPALQEMAGVKDVFAQT